MVEKNVMMNEYVKELVAIGASIGAHCQPCLESHIQTAVELGVSEADIRAAVSVGHAVEKGAMNAMQKFSAEVMEEMLAAATVSENQIDDKNPTGKVLKIYDPAMCCSSGVCGPGVDPVLAEFAGTLKFIAGQPGVQVERYNLGQEPQAFVENKTVKDMLGNGGEKELPFIFIDDQLWLKGRYPSKTALLDALKIKTSVALTPFPAQAENAGCGCGDGGCC